MGNWYDRIMIMLHGKKKQIVYVFIDASNLWDAQKSKGRMFDFEKLKKFLKNAHNAGGIQIFYYTAYPADGTRDYSAVFFSGDSDFLALVNYLKNGGKKVYIYSSKNNISEELRTGGDGYTDVLKIDEDIWGRGLRYREERGEK